MTSNDQFTRRNALRVGGVAAATAFLAGCADGGGPAEEDEEEPVDEAEENGAEVDDGEEDEGDDAEVEDEEEETDTDEEAEDDEGENGEAIEPGTTIVFDGQTAGWVGIEPSEIEGEENPTLVLQDGEDYEIGWEEGDGAAHNFEIWDGDGDVVDDLETEMTDDPDDDQILEFTASEETAQYVCNPHQTTMIGDIEVE